MLNAANTVDKVQHLNQQQGQLNQSQTAILINEQTKTRLTQTQQTENESAAKLIDEKDRGKRQKKEAGSSKPAEKSASDTDDKDQSKLPPSNSGNIIDIKI
jgi:hypothetical protein